MVFLCLEACIGDDRDVPSSYIQPELMKKILYECYVADAYNAERARSDQRLHLEKENVVYYKKILDNYGVDSKKFFASMNYYTTHPKAFNDLTDSLNNFAKRMGASQMHLPENTNHGDHRRHIAKPIRD